MRYHWFRNRKTSCSWDSIYGECFDQLSNIKNLLELFYNHILRLAISWLWVLTIAINVDNCFEYKVIILALADSNCWSLLDIGVKERNVWLTVHLYDGTMELILVWWWVGVTFVLFEKYLVLADVFGIVNSSAEEYPSSSSIYTEASIILSKSEEIY